MKRLTSQQRRGQEFRDLLRGRKNGLTFEQIAGAYQASAESQAKYAMDPQMAPTAEDRDSFLWVAEQDRKRAADLRSMLSKRARS